MFYEREVCFINTCRIGIYVVVVVDCNSNGNTVLLFRSIMVQFTEGPGKGVEGPII
jgi:hypothetical protein